MARPATCPYLPLEDVERKIERVWAREVIEPEITRELELRLAEDLHQQNAATIKQGATLSKRIEKLKRERYRWAEMAMKGAVPEDIAKEKQERLANELDACEVALAKADRIQQNAMQTLSNALRQLERCADAYARHDDKGRRLMNQACFTSIDTDGKILIAEVVRQPVFSNLETAAHRLLNSEHEEAPEDDSGLRGASTVSRVPTVRFWWS